MFEFSSITSMKCQRFCQQYCFAKKLHKDDHFFLQKKIDERPCNCYWNIKVYLPTASWRLYITTWSMILSFPRSTVHFESLSLPVWEHDSLKRFWFVLPSTAADELYDWKSLVWCVTFPNDKFSSPTVKWFYVSNITR